MLSDRRAAGERLAELLERYRAEAPSVLALPRGGVVVAAPIAELLGAPLDVVVCRKVGLPENPEYGLGAVAEDGTTLLDEPRVRAAGYSVASLAPLIERERREAVERAARYRSGRPFPEVDGRTVILVDDGIATGVTLRVAVRTLRSRHPRRIAVAVGVAPHDTLTTLETEVDDVFALERPFVFFAVGEFYRRFDPVSDAEVLRLLASQAATTAADRATASAKGEHPAPPA
jgi:putative phosphoribosyl transferase